MESLESNMESLESNIVKWAEGRPPWQVEVLRQLAQGETLGTDNFVEIAGRLASGDMWSVPRLTEDEIPGSDASRGKVAIHRVKVNKGVNALIDGEGLKFPSEGLTVVYGDNGSGKSGFARLLKDVSRARHQEDVLSNIFDAEGGQSPEAEFVISVDGVNQTTRLWPGAVFPETKQVCFFDEACGDAYLSTESEVMFRPAGIFLLHGLIRACDEVQREIVQRLDKNEKSAETLPKVTPGGDAERFLRGLSADTTDEEVSEACAPVAEAEAELNRLRSEEARLRSSDPILESKRLESLAQHYDTVGRHIEALKAQLSPDAINSLGEARAEASQLRAIADAASAQSFENEPVAGVGTQAWRSLWEAAREFAANGAGVAFPEGGHHCVLCHQELGEAARERFARFEQSVRDQTELHAAAAELRARQLEADIAGVVVKPEEVVAALEQIAADDDEAVALWRRQLKGFEAVPASLGDLSTCLAAAEQAVDVAGSVPLAKARSLRSEAEGIDSAQYLEKLLAVQQELQRIEDSKAMSDARAAIEREVKRRKRRSKLETAKQLTVTSGITTKATELARSHVTKVLRESFKRESKHLCLERVTLEDRGGRKGRLQHRPAFVAAVQQPAMASVLSEGEQTALGLAGFFTEASLDESRSAIVLDDPVSSLDHERRRRVADRLAQFAVGRQVIVFTHDLAFVMDLARAASEAGLTITELSIERYGDGRPGACREGHPWKTQDVKSRLHTLAKELDVIRRERGDWSSDCVEEKDSGWAGKLSETWERMISVELVGRVFDLNTLNVHPKMLKILARLTVEDNKVFQQSYGRTSAWARRHDKAPQLNYSPPTDDDMQAELETARAWYKGLMKYVN